MQFILVYYIDIPMCLCLEKKMKGQRLGNPESPKKLENSKRLEDLETLENLENLEKMHIRFVLAHEAPLAVEFMQKLGEFQKMSSSILVTQDEMQNLLEKGDAEAIFLEYDGKIKGFAFFCKHASAFIGKRVLYIDALFIDEDLRGKGAGALMMSFLAKISLEKNCNRMEWACLDWNKEAWDFYIGLDSQVMDTLTLHRLDHEKISKLALIYKKDV